MGRLHIDEKEFVKLKAMANFVGRMVGGVVAGTVAKKSPYK